MKTNFVSTDRRSRLAEQADILVKSSHLLASGLPMDLVEQFPAITPLLRTTAVEDWDFFGTVAAVGAGLLRVPALMPRRGEGEMAIRLANAALGEWDPEGPAALQDMMSFMHHGAESAGADLEMGVGLWFLWNVKGASPTAQESSLAPVIGGLLCASAWNCWHSPAPSAH